MAETEPSSTKPLAERLGIRHGMRIALLGAAEAELDAALQNPAIRVDRTLRSQVYDLVVVRIDEPTGLARITSLRSRINDDGAIWVVIPRGRRDLRDVDVIAAARANGLVDNKVARFSDTHTALRLVVPRALRRNPRRTA